MKLDKSTSPDYRAFAKDLRKLCQKHKIKFSAIAEGMVILGPATAKSIGDFPYNIVAASPDSVILGDDADDNYILVRDPKNFC